MTKRDQKKGSQEGIDLDSGDFCSKDISMSFSKTMGVPSDQNQSQPVVLTSFKKDKETEMTSPQEVVYFVDETNKGEPTAILPSNLQVKGPKDQTWWNLKAATDTIIRMNSAPTVFFSPRGGQWVVLYIFLIALAFIFGSFLTYWVYSHLDKGKKARFVAMPALAFSYTLSQNREKNLYRVTFCGETDQAIELYFVNQRHRVSGNFSRTFHVELSDLKVGDNQYKLVIAGISGNWQREYGISLPIAFRLNPLPIRSPFQFEIDFEIPAGSSVKVHNEEASLVKQEGQVFRYRFNLELLKEILDHLQKPHFKYVVHFVVVDAKSQRLRESHEVKLALPAAPLDLITPKENLVTTVGILKVVGSSEKAAAIYINGEKIRSDPAGKFTVSLALSLGKNLIHIKSCVPNKVATEKRLIITRK